MAITKAFTQAIDNRSFQEWHQGIKRYGFWAILIDSPAWKDEFSRAQAHVADLVHPNYRRTPHITLSACGLVSERYFSEAQLSKQIASIKSLDLPSFDLELTEIDSFDTAPYLAIKQHPLLNIIRTGLEATISDSPAPEYCPHLTLGFYQNAYHRKSVGRQLKQFRNSTIPPLRVNSISYCTYQTKDIQGELSLEHSIHIHSR